MAFRFKDLMVDVLAGGGGCPTLSVEPAQGQCPTLSVDPLQGTPCPTLSVDPLQGTPCPTLSVGPQFAGGGTTGICPTLSVTPTPGYALLATPTLTATTLTTLTTTPFICELTLLPARTGAENLAFLKQQLRQTLEQIEAQERAAREPVLPRTLEEADELERRIQGALKELQDHKKTLQKKPARKGRK
jgi:hypothetical protein